MKVVQLFNHEERSFREFDAMNADHRDAWFMSIRYDAALFAVVEFASGITIAIIIWQATGLADVGTLYVFIDWMRRFFLPLRDLSAKYSVMQSSMASAERIFQLLDTQPAVADREPPEAGARCGPPRARAGSGRVRPRELRLPGRGLGARRRHASGWRPARRSRSWAPPAPARPPSSSCSRASTIRPAAGSCSTASTCAICASPICAGGWRWCSRTSSCSAGRSRRTSRWAVRTWTAPASIGWPAPCAPTASSRRCPQGYETQVRERASNFSAGERQLLSFARALAHGGDVLVLDEATSSIDSETEALIQEGTHALLAGRTAIVIAHRLSTIQDVDRIHVLHKGRIVESGQPRAAARDRGGLPPALPPPVRGAGAPRRRQLTRPGGGRISGLRPAAPGW